MSKTAGIVLVAAGVVFIALALLLLLFNGYEEQLAGQKAEILLEDVRAAMQEKPGRPEAVTEAPPADVPFKDASPDADPVETVPPELPVAVIDGYEYIGYISISALELELPVMADWDYDRLKIAPCRHFGSSRTDDLVIAAHNYKTHFGYLSDLEIGTEVVFTDMDGIVNCYTLVKAPEILAADAVDAVQNSGHDLVLYTCTPGGATRVAVFCDRAAEKVNGEEHEGTEEALQQTGDRS